MKIYFKNNIFQTRDYDAFISFRKMGDYSFRVTNNSSNSVYFILSDYHCNFTINTFSKTKVQSMSLQLSENVSQIRFWKENSKL